jgi:spermidine synthase
LRIRAAECSHYRVGPGGSTEARMIPWKLLDSAQVPGGGPELRLYQRGEELSIRLVGLGELMNSRVHGSEEALADLTCAQLAGRASPRVLIGGLGMGFTLAAALRHLASDAEVVVAELVPAVVEWNRGPLAGVAGHPLEDRRVTVRVGDVAQILNAEVRAYDAVLLDVDNGPEGLTRRDNDWLYGLSGLSAAYAALRPGGVLAVWSAGPDRDFSERLRRAGFEAEELRVRSRANRKGARHIIWLARRAK